MSLSTKIFVLTLSSLCTSAFAINLPLKTATTPRLSTNAQVQLLEKYITGKLDTSDHAVEDHEFYNITLKHCRVTLDAPGAANNVYLYVEQSRSEMQDRPYRKRFMRLAPLARAGQVTSSIYEVEGADQYLGLCDKSAAERVVPASIFSNQSKCTVFLTQNGNNFFGSTPLQGCVSNHNGATYMTNKTEVSDGFMSSWDRGFNAEGKQMWGAVKGPYMFKRITSQNPSVTDIAATLIGKLSNKNQVAADPVNFYPVSYQMCQVKFPGQTADERYVYAEQIITVPSRTITRQAIYHFEQSENGKILLNSYNTTDSNELMGLCNKDSKTRFAMSPEIFKKEETCTLTYAKSEDGKKYVGTSPEGGCASTYAGAAKLVVEEELSHESIKIWERWYDAKGNQVAGSKTGPYIYLRD